MLPELRQSQPSGWRAHLELGFEQRGARTVLARRAHEGPLVVQRPFHPEDDGTCHVYLLHPPGGVVGGDQLHLDVEVAPFASALLTTPAATKLYRSQGATALLRQAFRVRSGATLEWLPQETIAFGGARARSTTRVELAPDARFLGWDIVCLGRPASGDDFARGRIEQRSELWSEGRPLVIDRLLTEADSGARSGAWAWDGRSVYGCLFVARADASVVRAVREILPACHASERASVTLLNGVLVCRYLGTSGARARNLLGLAWSAARALLLSKPACPPRIWAT